MRIKIYNESKYTKWYFSIIKKYGNVIDCDFEKHHIIPKSLDGVDNKNNITQVSARVHFILHKLLIKMVNKPKHLQKMKYALWRMMHPTTPHNKRFYRITSRAYQTIREEIRNIMKTNNPMFLEHNRLRMINDNPMHRSEIVAKFKGRKRPEQSMVCSKRNKKYWSDPKNKVKIKNHINENKEKYNKWWKVENVNTKETWIVLGLRDFCIKHKLKQAGLSNAMKDERLYKKMWRLTLHTNTVLLPGG